ncbi:MAG: hypothetical protein WA771_05210 [Chthoniobacterales bacterium]
MTRIPSSLERSAAFTIVLFVGAAAFVRAQDDLGPDPAVAVAAEGEVFAPPVYPIERYEHIWEKSPFVVETQVIEQSEGLGKRFSLTGLGSVGEKPVAFLLDRGSLERFSVALDEDPKNGVELVSIQLDSDPRESTATIRVGAEQAEIQYDPAALIASAPSNAAVPAPMSPASAAAVPTMPQPQAAPTPVLQNPALPATPPSQPGAARIIKRRQIKMPPK